MPARVTAKNVGGVFLRHSVTSSVMYFAEFKVLFVDRSRGFGFVIFTSPETLDSVQAARPHEIDGRLVDTKRALPKSVSK